MKLPRRCGLWWLLVWWPLLAACGDSSTPTPAESAQAPLVIPTFTPVPVTPTQPTTPTPTPIVVPPTETPTATPPPTPVPTPTALPTATPVPTLRIPPSPTPPVGSGSFRPITVEQARNLNGYRALLPAYLPGGYKLDHLSYGETPGTLRQLIIIADYSNAAGQVFYFTSQATPGLPPTPRPTATATALPGLTLAPLPSPTPTFTPRPTAQTTQFRQETVQVRGQPALLSYDDLQLTLSWSEGTTTYLLTGPLSREEALKVANSLQ